MLSVSGFFRQSVTAIKERKKPKPQKPHKTNHEIIFLLVILDLFQGFIDMKKGI